MNWTLRISIWIPYRLRLHINLRSIAASVVYSAHLGSRGLTISATILKTESMVAHGRCPDGEIHGSMTKLIEVLVTVVITAITAMIKTHLMTQLMIPQETLISHKGQPEAHDQAEVRTLKEHLLTLVADTIPGQNTKLVSSPLSRLKS
jgi:hypothetical protein